jgi:hypothetical protein
MIGSALPDVDAPAQFSAPSEIGKRTACLVFVTGRTRESPIRVRGKRSTFHPHAQRNAFRRDVRQQ